MSAGSSSSAPDSGGRKARRKSGVRSSAAGLEEPCRRRHNRYDVHLPVRMVEQGEPIVGHCDNISVGGMCVTVDRRLQEGDEIRIWIELPDSGTGALFLTGAVKWVDGSSVGVKHQLLGSQDTFVLTQYLASLSVGSDPGAS